MPDPISTLAIGAASGLLVDYLKQQGFAHLDDLIKSRPKDLSRAEPIRKAIATTANQFPQLQQHNLGFILCQWCNSQRFGRLYDDFQRNQSTVTDNLIVTSFNETAKGFEKEGAISSQSSAILLAFFKALDQSLLESSKGLAYHEALNRARHEEVLNEIQRSTDPNAIADATADAILSRLEARIRGPLASLAPSNDQLQRETEDTSHQALRAQIELAYKWSESGRSEAALSLIEEVRADALFSTLPDAVRARVATICAKCLMDRGETQKAIGEIEAALALQPDLPRYLSNAAMAALLQGHYAQAETLARRVLATEPDENAAMVLVQSYFHADEPDKIEEFLEATTWFFERIGCRTALAQIRSRQGRYDEAIELAKGVLEEQPDNVDALEALYNALYVSVAEAIQDGSILSLNAEAQQRLLDAETAADRAVQILNAGPNRSKLHTALCNRASARRAMGHIDLAVADCERVLGDNPTPDNRDLALLTKGTTLIRGGKAPDAIPSLESLQAGPRREEARHALAFCYQTAGRLDEAIGIWEETWRPEACDAQSMLTGGLLCWTHRRRHDNEAAEAVLNRLKQTCPDDPETAGIEAEHQKETGDLEGALQTLRLAVPQHTGVGQFLLLSRLGQYLFGAKRYTEAAAAWGEVPLEGLMPQYQDSYLLALYNAHRMADALAIAQTLQNREEFQPLAVEIEAAIRSYMGETRRARDLYGELTRREPNNPLYALNLAQLALQDEDPVTARSIIERIPYERVRDDAVLLRRISAMQAWFGLGDALRFAFRARQIDFGNPESHRHFFSVFLRVTQFHDRDENGNDDQSRATRVLGLNGPRPGTVPCTVRLVPPSGDPAADADRQDYIAFTILEEAPFHRKDGFYPADDEWAQRLLQLKPRETIKWRQSPGEAEREYRVAPVFHPFVHAFQESGLRSGEWFPGAAPIHSIDVSDNDLSQFWAMMDELSRGFDEMMAFYADWRFPLCTVGTLRGRSVFDLWLMVVGDRQIGLHAGRGTVPQFMENVAHLALTEAETAETQAEDLETRTPETIASSTETSNTETSNIETSNTAFPDTEGLTSESENSQTQYFQTQHSAPTSSVRLVLDMTALHALVTMKMGDLIDHHWQLLAPDSLRQELKTLLHETESDESVGSMRRVNGAYVFQDSTAEGRIGRSELLRSMLTFLETRVQVLPARAIINYSKDQIEEWEKAFGRSAQDSLLLAQEHGALLYSDDAVFVRVCQSSPLAVGGVNTQHLLYALHHANGCDRERHNQALEVLVRHHFRHLLIDVDFLHWLLERHDHAPVPVLRAALSSLEAPLCDDGAAIGVAAHVVKWLWLRENSPIRREGVLALFLDALTTGRDTRVVLGRFKQTLNSVGASGLGAASLRRDDCFRAINAWHQSHIHVIRPGQRARPVPQWLLSKFQTS